MSEPHPITPAQAEDPVPQNAAECSSAPFHSRHPARYILNGKELTERQHTAAQLLLRGRKDSDVARIIRRSGCGVVSLDF